VLPAQLPAQIEQRLARLPASDANLVRQQLEYARAQVATYRTGGIAIGTIVKDRTTYYYAAAVAGAYEVAAHGYRRRVLPAVPNGAIVWVPEVVLERVGQLDTVTVTGTVPPGTVLTASPIHHFVAPSGSAATVWSTPSVVTTIGGDFRIAGFSPGDYRFTLTRDGRREAFDLTLPNGGELDLGTRPRQPFSIDDGYVVVSSTPKARVAVDGIDTGLTTPTKLTLSPGKHKITFSYGTTRSTFAVRVVANETVPFHKDLQ